jgi:hypothetical protein
MPVQYFPLPTRVLWENEQDYIPLRIAPGALFRREVRLRLHRQTLQPTLPHCSFRDTTHDAWRTCERCGKKQEHEEVQRMPSGALLRRLLSEKSLERPQGMLLPRRSLADWTPLHHLHQLWA